MPITCSVIKTLQRRSLLIATIVGFMLVLMNALPGRAADKDVHDGAKVTIDERYRYEFVDQASLAKDAHASTLRSRVGLVSPLVHYMRLGIEFENVAEIGDDAFNNTINGKTDRPIVVDVESSEVNQAYFIFTGIPGTTLLGGRYRLNLDNQRFIGSVGWRQNDQTFDGATVTNTSLPETTLFYGYIGNINRIFSSRSPIGDLESNAHLAHVTYSGLSIGTLKAYDYYLNILDAPALSSNTFGASLTGMQPLGQDLSFVYYLEYAHQNDVGDNPVRYSANYYHLAPGISASGWTATVGYEVLGSDGGRFAFATPLATLHIYNGFADVFVVTPAAGLEDLYFDITYKAAGLDGPYKFLNGLVLKAQYHDFRSQIGNIHYGQEFDAFAKLPLGHGFYAEAKYANYQAGNFAVDTEKFIFGLGYKTAFDPHEVANRFREPR